MRTERCRRPRVAGDGPDDPNSRPARRSADACGDHDAEEVPAQPARRALSTPAPSSSIGVPGPEALMSPKPGSWSSLTGRIAAAMALVAAAAIRLWPSSPGWIPSGRCSSPTIPSLATRDSAVSPDMIRLRVTDSMVCRMSASEVPSLLGTCSASGRRTGLMTTNGVGGPGGDPSLGAGVAVGDPAGQCRCRGDLPPHRGERQDQWMHPLGEVDDRRLFGWVGAEGQADQPVAEHRLLFTHLPAVAPHGEDDARPVAPVAEVARRGAVGDARAIDIAYQLDAHACRHGGRVPQIGRRPGRVGGIGSRGGNLACGRIGGSPDERLGLARTWGHGECRFIRHSSQGLNTTLRGGVTTIPLIMRFATWILG